MALAKNQQFITTSIVVSLLALIFLPSQIPIDSVKVACIAILGGGSLLLQFVMLGRSVERKHKMQSIVLMLLTLVITTILLFI